MPISFKLNANNAILLGTVKKNYPSLSEKRIDRLFDKINDTLFNRGVINCSHKGIRGAVGGEDFFEYLLKAIVNWSDSGQVAGEVNPGLVKEINNSLNQRDVHLRDRTKHQRRRDQARFNVLLHAADQIQTGANDHSIIAAAGQAITDEQAAKTSMNKLADGKDIYDRPLFNKLVQKAFLDANPEVVADANKKLWREAIEFAQEEALKKKQREEELARRAQQERDEKLRQQTALMRRTHNENVEGVMLVISSSITTWLNTSKIDFNQSLVDQSKELNDLLDEVDKVFVTFEKACDDATKQHLKYEKMKKAVAKGLFKAVVNLAPPPLNIAAGAVAGLAKTALDSAGNLEGIVSVFVDNVDAEIASVGGSSDFGGQTRNAIEEIKADTKNAAKSYLSATPPPNAGSIVNTTKLKDLLKQKSETAVEETKDTFKAVLGGLDKKTSETWSAFFQRRLGAINSDLAAIDLMEGMSADQLSGLSQTDMLLRSNAAIGNKTTSIIQDFYERLDSDLKHGWAPFVQKKHLVKRYFELYFWAMYCAQHFITGATPQRGLVGGMMGGGVTLPNLGDACIQRLQKLDFVDTTSGRFVTPYMGGNEVTSVTYRGSNHRGDKFMIYYTLGGWAMAGPALSPFNLIFQNSSPDDMKGKIESCLTTQALIAVDLREKVRTGTSVINFRMRRDRRYHKQAKSLFKDVMSRK